MSLPLFSPLSKEQHHLSSSLVFLVWNLGGFSKLKNLSPMASSMNLISFPGYSTSFKETLINPNMSPSPLVLSKDFLTIKSQLLSDQKGLPSSSWNAKTPLPGYASICVIKSMRWCEKIPQPNMIEIKSAEELVDTLSNSGERLVIVEFYSPGCGGCKALHPKICQLAESNPNAIFLQVNHKELKPMCHALHIHVLPFFRFYKGSQGKICSFSCTIKTIKKLVDFISIKQFLGMNMSIKRIIHLKKSSSSIEYGAESRAYGAAGHAYFTWAAKMAVGLNTGVPWVMCKQDDAPDPIVCTFLSFIHNSCIIINTIKITTAVLQLTTPVMSKGTQCFLVTSSITGIFPDVSLNFAGDADMNLKPQNYLVHGYLVDGGTPRCIGWQKVQNGVSILGDIETGTSMCLTW